MSSTTEFSLNVIIDSHDAQRHDVTVHAKDRYGMTLTMAARTYDFTEKRNAANALIAEVTTQLITKGF